MALGCCAIALSSAGYANVVVNEVELSPSENYIGSWVEIYNSGDDAVDISGWSAQILDPPWGGTVVVPSGTAISPKCFYVLDGDHKWVHNSSGVVILRAADGSEIDRTPLFFDNKTDDFSWSRYPDGKDSGRKSDWAYLRSTRGSENANIYS
jgi:hypothetical protein